MLASTCYRALPLWQKAPLINSVLRGTAEGAAFTGTQAGIEADGGVGDRLSAAASGTTPGAVLGGGFPLVTGTIGRIAPAMNALSNAVGPIVGRVNPLMDEAGSQLVTPSGVPVAANATQARLAGQQAIGLMSNPDAVKAALDNAPPPAIPGAPQNHSN